MQNPDVTFFAESNFRNSKKPVGIYQADRLYHTYIIGKTGTGKTTMLRNMIQQDIRHLRGMTLLDPHGDLVESVYKSIPEHQKDNVIYINATDPNQPYGYNPIRRVAQDKRPLLAAGILSVFEHLFKDAWGSRIEHILRYVILTLLDQPQASFRDIPKILNDKIYRKQCQRNIISPDVLNFWKKEFYRYRDDALAPILSKTGAFLSYPTIKQIFVEPPKVSLSLRKVMDEGKILLVNLSKGIIGEDAARIIGSLFITSLGLAAFSRANVLESERKQFMIYIDEFQNFSGGNSMDTLLSELRKYKVGLVMAHQYIDQLDGDIRNAILGNIGTLISFRIGARDAPFIAKEMYPEFDTMDLTNLPNYHIYLKLMIDGRVSGAFSGMTIAYLHE